MKDAIIVLAGGINNDGSLPDLPRRRVDGGIAHFNNKESSVLIMTGKYGFWLDWTKEIPLRSEAQAMKEYAVSQGVPQQNIFLDERSKDTLGNAYFTKVDILEPHNWKKVIVITSDFHYERTKFIFDLVLGPDYEIEYDLVETGLSPEKVEALHAQEVKTVSILKEITGKDIIPGDTEAVKNVLFTKHPGYADNPEYTYEKLREMLGRI
jgi:uncharacterized SAM-binding protein YcdF (DUF218 family)